MNQSVLEIITQLSPQYVRKQPKMNDFILRLSNIIAWFSFLFLIIITPYFAYINISELTKERNVYCAETLSNDTSKMDSRSYELLNAWISCSEGNDAEYREKIHTSASYAKFFFFSLVLLAPYVVLLNLNYLITGYFRPLPWRKINNNIEQ